jgi:uncharacterized protein (DUF1501 family)
MTQHSSSRRDFLRRGAALSSASAALPFALNMGAITQASAQAASGGYRALVCIYLSGGNDAFNTVLATDEASWGHYVAHRQAIALPAAGVAADASAASSSPAKLGGVLPISQGSRGVHATRRFALHPAMPQMQQLYQAGRVAVVANVGPLNKPLTKAEYADARTVKPPKLFSHNDQQSVWQSFRPEGSSQGWAGLMGDALMAGNGVGHQGTEADLIRKSFTCMTPTNAMVWLAGRSVLPFQSSSMHVASLGYSNQIYDSVRLHRATAAMLGKLRNDGQPTVAPRNMFAADTAKLGQRALQTSDMLAERVAALGTGPWSTPTVTDTRNDPLLKYVSPADGRLKLNPLATQLQMVARLIDTNRAANLGMTRQFFMVNLGGFDTHSSQIAEQAERLAQLSHAMAYFDTVLNQMPSGDMRSQVTTFTASEFGRSFTSNGDGTDHGWGSHHFVMGGAVQGTEVYGTFPQYSTADSHGAFGSPDQIQNGVLLPTTSVDHLAYTLGRWMGVSSDLMVNAGGTGFLPNLGRFPSSGHDLGFMRA